MKKGYALIASRNGIVYAYLGLDHADAIEVSEFFNDAEEYGSTVENLPKKDALARLLASAAPEARA